MYKLNKRFKDALLKDHVKYDSMKSMLITPKRPYTLHALRSRLRCCGIDELVVSTFQEIWRDDKKYAEEALAHMIRVGTTDHRIIIIGIPTRVGTASMYNMEFYTWVKKTLLSFGFKEMVKRPYRNQNSHNDITVLAGQLP